MSSLSYTHWSPWLLFGAVIAVAIVRASTATPISDARPATEAERASVFLSLAREERTMRRDAAKDFPADLWSQDDAFHNFELQRARALANRDGIRLPDVLLASDQGLHGQWPAPANVSLNPFVPPCRPRPIH
ncbi:hypothetical protein [Pendulispora albinea]|uniref:Uncharacterized protein n=1 Tax=Pendulispora albinea TaxID=2741071 RepID=A0ABZ2M4R9_9BACT